MKMKLTFLLVASVFFVSCGMPTVFNLNTGEYFFQMDSNSSEDTISSSFKITTSNPAITSTIIDSKTQGPSLMFFYTISDSNTSNYTIGEIKDALISAFSTKIKKEPFGINNPIYHELVFKKIDEEKKVSLYEFKGFNNKKFSLPDLILTGNSNTVVPKLDSFTLQAKPTADTSRYYIELNVVTADPTNSFTPISVDLYGFEGKPFFSNQDDIPSGEPGEYVYLPTGASEVYLNIFSAFSVLGDFTNIYWSELNYIGQIKLPIITP